MIKKIILIGVVVACLVGFFVVPASAYETNPYHRGGVVRNQEVFWGSQYDVYLTYTEENIASFVLYDVNDPQIGNPFLIPLNYDNTEIVSVGNLTEGGDTTYYGYMVGVNIGTIRQSYSANPNYSWLDNITSDLSFTVLLKNTNYFWTLGYSFFVDASSTPPTYSRRLVLSIGDMPTWVNYSPSDSIELEFLFLTYQDSGNNTFTYSNKYRFSMDYRDVEINQVDYDNAFGAGHLRGYYLGYEAGYADGGLSENLTVFNFFESVFRAPFLILNDVLDFDIFGVNMANFARVIISFTLLLLLVGIVLKYVL